MANLENCGFVCLSRQSMGGKDSKEIWGLGEKGPASGELFWVLGQGRRPIFLKLQ